MNSEILRSQFGNEAARIQSRGWRKVPLSFILAAGSVFQAAAISDDFEDGNDSSPLPAWTRSNPISTGNWSFPGGNSYRLQSAVSVNPGVDGPGRAASFLPVTYTNFYVAVDILDWNNSLRQVAGVAGRIGNIGAGITRGYVFRHDRGNPALSGGEMQIVRLDNEVPSVLATYGATALYFEPGQTYRLVFLGIGSNFVGQVYHLPDTLVPIAHITATDNAYASGYSGLIAADSSPAQNGAADATFDNFVASIGQPYLLDDFNDGDDANPLPAWSRYDPIGTGTFSFPGGTSYRFQSAPSPDPGTYGQGRAGSLRPGNFSNFYVSTDLVNWEDNVHQLLGVLARITTPGPGTTGGYLFSYDRGDMIVDQGDMDIVRLDGEVGTTLSSPESDKIHFEPGRQYRLVFMGTGGQLRGQVFELPDTLTPKLELTATDDTYPNGASGLVAANNAEESGFDGPADATFDNFLMLPAEPRLTARADGPNVEVTWPLIPYRLQKSISLSPAAWSDVTSGISRTPTNFSYHVLTNSGHANFRLIYP